jgi:hypothetical protein
MFAVLRFSTLKSLGAIGLLLLATQTYAAEPTPQPAARSAANTLNQGKKWDTDAATRQAMETIRQAMQASQSGIDKDQFTAQDYQRLAELIDQTVATMMKTRTLSKEAAKAFHLVVMVDLSQNLNLMLTGRSVALQRTGALGTQQSLRNYGVYFQHPGWL